MAQDEAPFDVAIVGFGPTGAMLANLLGRDGLRTVVLEREPDVYTLPRAVHFDHEVMRIFQSAGLAEAILPHTGPVKGYEFWTADRKVLLSFDTRGRITDQGWQPDYMFHQPSLERALRRAAGARESVEVRLGRELVGLDEDAESVTARLRRADGGSEAVRARWLVGCDGAASPTRGFAGLDVEDLAFDEPWLVVDATVKRSPDALGLPDLVLQLCDPRRPTTFMRVTGPYVRWEFMLRPGEGQEMREPARVRALLADWTDPDALELVRCAVYRFHALVGRRWRTRRMLLAGDAVHQMPPFLGQGMCAGIRDAANLSWKLRLVLAGAADQTLLDTYAEERAPHVRAVVELAVEMGRIICTQDATLAAQRDASMLATEGGAAPERPELPPLAQGALQPAPRHPLAGRLALQARVRDHDGREGLLDDRVGTGFTLLWNGAAQPLSVPAQAVLERVGGRQISIVPEGAAGAPRSGGSDPALEDVDGAYAAWFRRHEAEAVLVRPDHYVFGATGRGAGASELVEALGACIGAR